MKGISGKVSWHEIVLDIDSGNLLDILVDLQDLDFGWGETQQVACVGGLIQLHPPKFAPFPQSIGADIKSGRPFHSEPVAGSLPEYFRPGQWFCEIIFGIQDHGLKVQGEGLPICEPDFENVLLPMRNEVDSVDCIHDLFQRCHRSGQVSTSCRIPTFDEFLLMQAGPFDNHR